MKTVWLLTLLLASGARAGEAARRLCLAAARNDPKLCGSGADASVCRNFYNRAILSKALVAHDPGFLDLCRKGKVDSGENPRSQEENDANCRILLSAEKDVAGACAKAVARNHPPAEVAAEFPKCVSRFSALWGLAEECDKRLGTAGAYDEDYCRVSDAAAAFRKAHEAHAAALCRGDALCRVMMGEGPEACQTAAEGVQWVRFPGGAFMMGQGAEDRWPWAKPAHPVTLKPFELAKTSVTNKQYKACVAAGACAPAHYSDGKCGAYDENGADYGPRKLPPGFEGDDQPVVCVDWEQASAFSRWAGGRLPSEAEWEYAARGAGKDIRYPWGDEEATCERAVMSSAASGGDGCGRKSSWPVCSKPKGNTEHGLCDMAGNVQQWTQDRYHQNYDGAPSDGRAWEEGGASNRIVRGGSWGLDAWHLRTVNRGDAGPSDLGENYGFRPARSVGDGGGPAAVARLHQEFLAAESSGRAGVLEKVSQTPPADPGDVRALFELFRGYPAPEVRAAVLGSLRGLKPDDAALAHAFIPYFDDKQPEAQLFAIHGSLALRDKDALVFLHELAHRRFEAKSAGDIPEGPERDRWQAQYDALEALAQWEGKQMLERLRQRSRQAPAVARILATYLWKEALPEMSLWAASSAPGDRERVKEALAAPVEPRLLCETRSAMLKIVNDPGADEGLRRGLAAKVESCPKP